VLEVALVEPPQYRYTVYFDAAFLALLSGVAAAGLGLVAGATDAPEDG